MEFGASPRPYSSYLGPYIYEDLRKTSSANLPKAIALKSPLSLLGPPLTLRKAASCAPEAQLHPVVAGQLAKGGALSLGLSGIRV